MSEERQEKEEKTEQESRIEEDASPKAVEEEEASGGALPQNCDDEGKGAEKDR